MQRLTALLFVLGLGACSSSSTAPSGLSSLSQPQTVIGISPGSASVQVDGSVQFAVLAKQNGRTFGAQGFAWSVAGAGCAGVSCGTIDIGGRYTAPAIVPNPATVTVTATSPDDATKSWNATVTILLVLDESVSISPTSVEFGNQVVNTTSEPRAVLVTNTGRTPQSVYGYMSGTQDFASTDDCPSVLAVGASCTINITFTPNALGGRATYLEVFGDYSVWGYVHITGTGTT